MSMSQNDETLDTPFWIATQDLLKSPGHPFYQRINKLLREHGFDRFVEGLCAKFYAEKNGRPSIPPGVYFRMLFIGYWEALDSDRGIAWRCRDSRTLQEFLGYRVYEATPNHSSLSVIRQRLDLETHRQVFQWMLKLLTEHGLVKGENIGVDATTAEANAAMRSIIRRDTEEGYQEYLHRLAQEEGIAEPTAEDRKRIDKKRPKKASNHDWKSPQDADARIAKMKNGSTHLAHKVEHAVDLDSGAIVAVTVQEADRGDTDSMPETLLATLENIEAIQAPEKTETEPIQRVVADGGYYSEETLQGFGHVEVDSYIADGKKKNRCCEQGGRCEHSTPECENRERIKSELGVELRKKRSELVERSFEHCYGRAELRRMHLRGHEKIAKRLLLHVAAFNMSLILRKQVGVGTPKEYVAVQQALLTLVIVSICHELAAMARFQKYSTMAELQNRFAAILSALPLIV